jgi:deazaflavin-dependent oxidoreductase (nitroreductase family)
MTVEGEHTLLRATSVTVCTKGRRTGRPHRVVVWFVYQAGMAYLLAHAGEDGRGTDWYQNLMAAGAAEIEAGGVRFPGCPVPYPEPEKAVATIVRMFEKKYGNGTIQSWYTPGARIPVCLKLQKEGDESAGARARH